MLVRCRRIGHALYALHALRGYPATFELWPRFRALRLGAGALSTPADRVARLLELDDLGRMIERARGVELSNECLVNPLARAAEPAKRSATDPAAAGNSHMVCEIAMQPN